MDKIGILSEAYYLPLTKKKVVDVFRDENVPFGTLSKDIDFQRDIGIEEIHVTDELPSSLALKAAQKAIEKANISPDEVDLILDFTSIPEDYIGPTWSAAGILQDKLSLNRAFATAINTGGCASYHVALKTVSALMLANDDFNTALLFAGDKTPTLNKTYYPITVASDGGSAIILKKNYSRATILGVETISVGRLHDVWYVPGLSNRNSDEEVSETLLHMHCKMEKFNESVIPLNFVMFRKVMKRLLDKMGMEFNDIDYYIYPTFSEWDQHYFMKRFSIPPSKIYTQGLRYRGHVQESDMIINYAEAIEQNLIHNGDKVMVVSNGAGFAWSAALIQH